MANLCFPVLETLLPYVLSDAFEERALLAALREAGVEWRFVDWAADPPATCDAVSSKFLWGYHLSPERWTRVLAAYPERAWINDKLLLEWNTDKSYLKELGSKGVDVGELEIFAPGSALQLSALAAARGWTEIVIKPTLSAGSNDTFRGAPGLELQAHASRILEDRGLLVQPFYEDVLLRGETSLVIANGEICYAVNRRVTPGDFRAHPMYGGEITPVTPATKTIDQALELLTLLPSVPTYCRVDGFLRADDSLIISELELIDPNLFVGWAPAPGLARVADAFAQALSAK
jgi:glutathione synthase/RimK-type ligase-like ATP-grasp enzyme